VKKNSSRRLLILLLLQLDDSLVRAHRSIIHGLEVTRFDISLPGSLM
jgi:hypothetical protein